MRDAKRCGAPKPKSKSVAHGLEAQQALIERELASRQAAATLASALSVRGVTQVVHAFLLEHLLKTEPELIQRHQDAAAVAYSLVGEFAPETFAILEARFGDVDGNSKFEADRQLPQRAAFEQGFRFAIDLVVPILGDPLGGQSLGNVIARGRKAYAAAFRLHLAEFDGKRADAGAEDPR